MCSGSSHGGQVFGAKAMNTGYTVLLWKRQVVGGEGGQDGESTTSHMHTDAAYTCLLPARMSKPSSARLYAY